MASGYDHKQIEKKWQDKWAAAQAFAAADDSSKPKTYVLDMFPYPSGEGLHVGHPKGYIATDIYSRHMRMRGHNVLHPMGWDAFGLPAENFALKNKIHPRLAVEKNIANFKEQLAHIGFDYDWSREVNTTDPAYYKWTQWIFLQMFKKGLAYQSNEPINWCPSCMTGLANEDLDGDVCERCGTKVEKKSLPQWVLKITAYADRMLQDLDALQWPEYIKEAQRNWIGRSEGALLKFQITNSKSQIEVFTTRPDTLFGATYIVLAPEHPLVQELVNQTSNKDEVLRYIVVAKDKTEIERGAAKDKTGVELKGVKAINPATKEEIPIFVADYVLWGYGTGAIMAVPAHDERDFEFAKKFNIPIRQVVEPVFVDETEAGKVRDGEPFVEREAIMAIVKHWSEDKYIGLKWKKVAWQTLITGAAENGQTMEEGAIAEIVQETGYLHPKFIKNIGRIHSKFYHVPKKVNRFAHFDTPYFELQDGEQQDTSAEEKEIHDVKWLTRDEMAAFLSPAAHQYAWECLLGNPVYTSSGLLADSGEFSGMDNEEAKKKITEFVGGTMTTTYKLKDWVFSRQRYWGEPIPIIHCPKDGAVAVPDGQLPVLLPEVTSYEPSGTGESPLATITEWVNTTCPTCGGPAKRETNTMPQWAGSSWYYLRFMDPHNNQALVDPTKEKYWAPVDVYVGGDHAVRHLIYARFWHKFLYDIGAVSTIEPFARLEFLGFILAEDGRKMSKRYGNVINPTDVVALHGADVFRLYEMFMGPFENTVRWKPASINGVARFVERVWKAQALVQDAAVPALDTILERTVKKVEDDIEAFKFNTAVSQMMILLNAIEKEKKIGTRQWMKFLQILNPFAPHIAHELAELAGFERAQWEQWPAVDAAKLVADTVTVGVQVNGKLRGSVELAADASQEEALAAARVAVKKWAVGTELKAVYVPGKIVSLVFDTKN